MSKPDFFIVGAPRCGTTAMDDYLKQHPEIFMAALKESHFFAPDFQVPGSSFKSEEHYSALFSEVSNEKILGESSVGYLYSKVAPARIKEFNPQAKIIIMLRNPVEMIYSYHGWLLAEGFEKIRDFEAHLVAESERRQEGRSLQHVPVPLRLYRELGEFSPHVKRFFDLFGRRNVHVIIFDEFKADTARVYREACEFLGVRPDFQPTLQAVNSNRRARNQSLATYLTSLRNPQHHVFYGARHLLPQTWRRSIANKLRSFNIKTETRPEMSQALKKQLSAKFAPDLECLSGMLGLDLTHWSRR